MLACTPADQMMLAMASVHHHLIIWQLELLLRSGHALRIQGRAPLRQAQADFEHVLQAVMARAHKAALQSCWGLRATAQCICLTAKTADSIRLAVKRALNAVVQGPGRVGALHCTGKLMVCPLDAS